MGEMRILLRNFIVSIGLLFSGFTLASSDTFVSVQDTTAGQSTAVRVSGLLSHETVELKIDRPEVPPLSFMVKADDMGVLTTNILGLHLQKSGTYYLSLKRSFESLFSEKTAFTVDASSASAYKSTVKLNQKALAADGHMVGFFTIKIRDVYGNPVSGEKIKVISSRNEDLLVVDPRSDEQGVSKGKITSKTPGVSVLSILSDGMVLFEKPEVIFYLANKQMEDVGAPDIGQFLKAQLFEDEAATSVAYFTIEDLPSEVFTDKRYTFRVIAKDENGNVVPNFFGKVRFASTDDLSTFPVDYEFDATDQGVHTFALAVIFATEGSQTLTVHDTSDFRISGESTVNVVDKSKQNLGDDKIGITILTPTPGTFRTSRVTITGKAIGTRFIKIMDGPTELVKDLEVDTSGEFIYQTPALADGTHKFIATSSDGALVSEVVTITVDQSPPTVLSIELDPRKVMDPDEPFKVTVSSDEPLSEASCILNEISVDLALSGDRFTGDFQAPRACGSYPISCTIADLLGNKLEEPNAEILQVCEAGEAGVTSTEIEMGTETEVPTETPVVIAPTTVSNLSAQSGEGRITLFWSPAKDDGQVARYRIIYGKETNLLNSFNVTPDNRTQWYIDGLDEGVQYYFQVFAVDDAGKTSVGSNIVASRTKGVDVHASAPKQTPTSGGSHWVPAGIALLVGILFMFLVRRRNNV